MPVGSVDYYRVYPGFHKGLGTLHAVGRNSYSGGHAQTSELVFAGERFVFGFGDVFVRNESDQPSGSVHHGKLLDFMALQDVGGFFEVGALVGCDEVF